MIWTFRSFEVDERHYVVRRDGEALELRPKVFDVLRYLLLHRDRVVSKDELLSEVWAGESISEGVVPQYITALRKALGDNRADARVIQTVHGRGYRFVAEVSVREEAPAPTDPLVGRQRVMSHLGGLVDEVLTGKGRFALVLGEAGIGKTRVAEELSALARARGALVLAARCHEGIGAPAYWPWVQILRGALGEPDGVRAQQHGDVGTSDVARLLGELGQPVELGSPPQRSAKDSGDARFRLFDSVARLLKRLARQRPLLLVLDDLHWADEGTLQLLGFVTTELSGEPLLVLGTSRPVNSAEDGGAEDPSSPILKGLSSGTRAQRIKLEGLSPQEVGELTLASRGHALDDAVLKELHAITEGNPFFVHELLRLMGEDEADWRMTLPGRVREVVGLRLSSLGEPSRRVLSLASVIGPEFRLAVLERIAGLPRTDLLSVLQEAASRRILADDGPGAYRFAHALICESLYTGLHEPERVRLHAAVGCALEEFFGADIPQHLPELAHHFGRGASAGEVARAVDYGIGAARQAMSVTAFDQAVGYYRAALDALTCKLPIDEEKRFALKLGLGKALFRAGKNGNSELLGAAETARRLERPELLATAALAMTGWPRLARFGRTSNRELYPLLLEAVDTLPTDATESEGDPQAQHSAAVRARLLSALALNQPRGTPLSAKVALSREALVLARSTGQDEARYDALLSRLQLMQAPEDIAQRLGLASELVATAERLGEPALEFTAHRLRSQPLLALGDIAAAEREIAACRRLAQKLHTARYELQVLRLELQRALGDGRFDEIGPLTERAVRVRGRTKDSPLYVASMFVWVLFAQAQRGDRKWIEQTTESLAQNRGVPPMMRSHVAYLKALLGATSEARWWYGPMVDPALADMSRDDDWLTTQVLTAQAIATCGDAEAAALLYPRLLPFAALNATHLEMLVYFGSVSHFLGLLAALGEDRAAAAEHFEAALEMNATLGARPALAQTSLQYARLLLTHSTARGGPLGGRRSLERGRSLLAEATTLGRELGMAGLLEEARALSGECP
ncbi:MAG: AAA family ATPase [Myxococcales bacterium]|nr:AAA family ATPase [Myxococcales bacterium]